jgi:hypothetical protein
MRTLPRHLLLAAVVLTVCCAQRQAACSVDLQRVAAEMAGERLDQSRTVEQGERQRRFRHHLVRPANPGSKTDAPWAGAAGNAVPAAATPECPVVHVIYPPSRFRLPPPAVSS